MTRTEAEEICENVLTETKYKIFVNNTVKYKVLRILPQPIDSFLLDYDIILHIQRLDSSSFLTELLNDFRNKYTEV